VFLKATNKNMRFIVVLAKIKKLSNSIIYRDLTKYADFLILKNEFNKKDIINARNKIIKRIHNPKLLKTSL